jgi:hypothetical protein
VGKPSNLDYDCSHVTTCGITGSDGSSYPVPVSGSDTATGAQAVKPSADTTYTLSCYGEDGAPYSNPAYVWVVQTQVTVNNNPGLHEINP